MFYDLETYDLDANHAFQQKTCLSYSHVYRALDV